MSVYHDSVVGRNTSQPVPPPKKPVAKKKLPPVQKHDAPPPAAPVTPTNPAPTGPPSAVLQAQGFHGGLGDFAARVDAADRAHQQAYGVKAHPEVVLAVAKSDHKVDDFHALFSVPMSPTVARARSVLVHNLPKVTTAGMTPPQLIQGLREAAKGDGYRPYLEAHSAELELLQKDDRYGDTVNDIFVARSARDAEAHRVKVYAEGFNPAPLAGDFWNGINQIANSLVHAPAGLYMASKAVAEDVDQANPLNLHHPGKIVDGSFKNTRAMGSESVKQLVKDVTHPRDNWGYLVLDVFGFASLGAGAAPRIAAAGRAAKAGEAGAAVKALGTKPPTRRVVLSHGGYTEEALLSSNSLVALFQERRLAKRQARADADGPAGSISTRLPTRANEYWEKSFSFERKIGREASARMRVEHVAEMTLVHELEHAARTANVTASVTKRLTSKQTRELSRGQQKAIWVLATDDPTPLATNIAFHKRMIAQGVGSKKDHLRQLADLALAAKVLENPSPAFQRVVDLTRQVSDAMTRQKIDELGLVAQTAEGRVAKLGQALRGEELVGGKRVNPDSFYIPTQVRGKVKRKPSEKGGFFQTSAGPYGVPPPRPDASLTHEFTGKAIISGKTRIDATNLVGEAYGRTVRAVTVKGQHDKLWAAGAETPNKIPEEFQVAVRNTNNIPDELREVVAKLDEGTFTDGDAALLPKDMQALTDWLYPDKKQILPDDDVRWVDGRLLDDAGLPVFVPGLGTAAANTINAPVRFATLYLRPAYILNRLGNRVMLVLDQGFLNSIENLARASAAEELYGGANAAKLRALVGQGKSKSYITGQSGGKSKAVAEWWSRWTDRDERVASLLYYADRKGYKTPEQIDALLNDKTHRADLVEVTRRGNKALVEFDNLSRIEKNNLRHLIFVYPWVRGSAVWSLRTIAEHPAKVAILTELGRQAIENDTLLDQAPGWFKRIGYVPVGFNADGSPKYANGSSLWSFTTVGEFTAIAKGVFSGDPYAALGDLAGPAIDFGIHAVTGRDEFGNRYEGSQFWGAVKETLLGLPQLRPAQAKENEPLKPFNIKDRNSLAAHYRSALDQVVLGPSGWGGYLSLAIGGLAPKTVNVDALRARYWKDQPLEQREKWARQLYRDALARQSKFLERPVPTEVRRAIELQFARADYLQAWAKDNARAPEGKQREKLNREFYESKGLTAEDVSKLRSAVHRWDTDVALLASFKKPIVAEKMRGLRAQGLAQTASVNASQHDLYKYGREYTEWQKQLAALEASDATPAEVRAFVDAADEPHGSLPSFPRMKWAYKPVAEQEEAVRSAAAKGWDKLSSFDKRLLGVEVSPEVSKGWAAYEETLADYHAQPGNPSLAKEQKDGLARQIDRDYPGFAKDYAFAQQPRVEQFTATKVYESMPDRDELDANIIGPAKQTAAVIARDVKAEVPGARDWYTRQWAQYVTNEVEPWLAKHPELQDEIDSLGDGFLKGLVR